MNSFLLRHGDDTSKHVAEGAVLYRRTNSVDAAKNDYSLQLLSTNESSGPSVELQEGDLLQWPDGSPILLVGSGGILQVWHEQGRNFPITCMEFKDGKFIISKQIHG
jgi:hypothetical protein